MKYFNHMTSSVEDQKHEKLIERAGLAGYGAYWIVLEKIASQIRPECVSTSLELSWRNWARHLRTSTQKAQVLLRFMDEARLVQLTEDGGLIKVDAPNILKYGDEYTKRLGIKSRQTPDKLPRVSGTPAVPAVPEGKDLTPSAPAGGSEAPAVAPVPLPKKDACQHHLGCDKRGTIKINGRWYCPQHDPDQDQGILGRIGQPG
jgi:hypothetical protein